MIGKPIYFKPGKRILPLPGQVPAITLPKLPPLHKQMMNAGKAVIRNIGQAIKPGEAVRAPELVREERLRICEACEFYRATDERCSHSSCGCFVRVKTFLLAEKCPAGKWTNPKPPTTHTPPPPNE